MNEEIIKKLDEITDIIENDNNIKEYKMLKKDILNDSELLNKISKLKQIDSYNKEYLDLKNSILSNEKYKKYIYLEKEMFYIIKDINIKLNSLTEKRNCN